MRGGRGREPKGVVNDKSSRAVLQRDSSNSSRIAAVLVWSSIVLVTLGALFIDEDDVAHMRISIGICAFDSADAYSTMEMLEDLVREKGSGDICWHYFGRDEKPAGCDLYVMTSLQASRYLRSGEFECRLLATAKRGVRYSTGAVIVKPDGGVSKLAGERLLFSSPISAAGYLSPLNALLEAGPDNHPDASSIEFAGYFPDDERVVFGVLYGAFTAGGISLEKLRLLERTGVVREGELDVMLTGDLVPEIVLVSPPDVGTLMLRGFVGRLPSIIEEASMPLESGLIRLGIAGFAEPREEDIETIKRLLDKVPANYPGASSPPAVGSSASHDMNTIGSNH